MLHNSTVVPLQLYIYRRENNVWMDEEFGEENEDNLQQITSKITHEFVNITIGLYAYRMMTITDKLNDDTIQIHHISCYAATPW